MQQEFGEACSLNKNTDIDTKNNKIKIHSTITKDLNGKNCIGSMTKTGRKNRQNNKSDTRIIPFGILFDENDVKAVIDEQLEHSASDLLFSQKNGEIIGHSSFNAIFKRICKEAGMKKDCNVHMMKHTGVTRMIESSIDIYVISALVGTSTEVLKRTYAHVFDDFIEKEIQKSISKRKENDLILSNKKDSDNIIYFPFAK